MRFLRHWNRDLSGLVFCLVAMAGIWFGVLWLIIPYVLFLIGVLGRQLWPLGRRGKRR